jgi:hypothetical protein
MEVVVLNCWVTATKDAMGVEPLDDSGEVRQRACQTVDLINHNHLDQPLADMLQQLLERRPLHGGTRETAVVVVVPDQAPALGRLALDEGFAGLSLGLE